MNALGMVAGNSHLLLQGVIDEWCGYCCCHIDNKHEEAIEFYTKSKGIANQIGEKCQGYRSNQAIGNILSNNGKYEQAREYYEEGLTIALELEDRLGEGQSCLNLASIYCKDKEYETAIEWYEQALDIFETGVNGDVLKEKALTGSAVAWFNLGNTQKAIESIRKARNFSPKQSDKGW